LKSIRFDILTRVEKLAAAETPLQSGFASIPPSFCGGLIQRAKAIFCCGIPTIYGFLRFISGAGVAVGATQ
jgi:hypothetical protein